MFGAHFVASLTHRFFPASVFLAVFTLFCLLLQNYIYIYTQYIYIYVYIHIYICELKVVTRTQIRKDMWARKYHWDWCSVFPTRPPGSSRIRHGNSGSKQRTEPKKNKKLWSHPSFQEWRGAGLANLTVRNLLGRLLWYHLQVFFKNQKDSVFFFKAGFSPKPGFGSYHMYMWYNMGLFQTSTTKSIQQIDKPVLFGRDKTPGSHGPKTRPYDHEFPATVNALKRVQPKSAYWCVQGAMMPCY